MVLRSLRPGWHNGRHGWQRFEGPEINDSIRYVMWSRLRLAEPSAPPTGRARAPRSELFAELTASGAWSCAEPETQSGLRADADVMWWRAETSGSCGTPASGSRRTAFGASSSRSGPRNSLHRPPSSTGPRAAFLMDERASAPVRLPSSVLRLGTSSGTTGGATTRQAARWHAAARRARQHRGQLRPVTTGGSRPSRPTIPDRRPDAHLRAPRPAATCAREVPFYTGARVGSPTGRPAAVGRAGQEPR